MAIQISSRQLIRWSLVFAAILVIAWSTHIGFRLHNLRVLHEYTRPFGGSLDSDNSGPEWLRRILGSDCMMALGIDGIEVIQLAGVDGPRDETIRLINAIACLKEVRRVNIIHPAVTDQDLLSLTRCQGIEDLSLQFTKVTSRGLRHLAVFPKLERLGLNGPLINDEALEAVSHLEQVNELSIMQSTITNAGLKHLGCMTQLKSLTIQDMLVTDAGLAHLSGLNGLKLLCLVRTTHSTPSGLEELRKRLPGLEILEH